MTRQTITVGTNTIAYELVRSRRRSVGISVGRDGVICVRAPLAAADEDVARLVSEKASWILKKRRQVAALPAPLSPAVYSDGEIHYYLGCPYPLAVTSGQRQGAWLADGRLHLRLRKPGDPQRSERVLREWYRSRAREVFAQRLEACYPRAAALGLPFPTLTIRLMKSRWGSCAADGTVQLNLRLIQTPPPSIDHVIYHELAHLGVRAHNRAFYRLLAALEPDWRQQRENLNRLTLR